MWSAFLAFYLKQNASPCPHTWIFFRILNSLWVFFFMKQHSPGSTEILMIISQWGVLQVCAMNNSQQADYHLETKKGQTGLDSNLE